MRTDICKAGLVFGAAALALGGCEIGVDGNGQRATEVRSLEGFSAIDSAAGLDVQINQGETFRVEVSIDSNLLDRVRTDVSGDTLTIDEEWIGDTLPGPHVIVTMPVLRRASIFGSGAIRATGCNQAEPVALTIDGSGELGFVGAVPRASVRISGSGDARLQGTA